MSFFIGISWMLISEVDLLECLGNSLGEKGAVLNWTAPFFNSNY